MLTGSSTRNIRRGAANLLAGRAYTYHLFPLTYQELGDSFDLGKALRIGCLPILWKSKDEDYREFLLSYAETYLREEVAAEGLVRNIGPFSHFLDIAAAGDGETVNYSNIARECGVSVKTAQQYYQILEDTFLAYKLPAWHKSRHKQLIGHPRYYFFDTGVTNALSHTLGPKLNPVMKGRRFEQFIITQLLAFIHYRKLDYQLYYWRTNHGAEVDVLICRGDTILCALEIKSSRTISRENLGGLKSFIGEHPDVPSFVLGINQTERLVQDTILVIDWRDFFEQRLGSLE